MSVSRREFLRLGAAAGVACALSGVSCSDPGEVKDLDEIRRRIHRHLPEDFVASVCGACPAACPILLRRVGGRIVGVRPFRSKPCARAYSGIQELYHPDRLRTALRSAGPRGSDTFESIDKATALDALSSNLRDGGGKTAFLLGESSSLSTALVASLAGAVGSRWVSFYDSPLSQGPLDALEAITGWKNWDLDLESSGGVVSFGWDWLQSHPNSSRAQAAFRRLRDENSPIVYVGPRYCLSATRSLKTVSCKPGSESLVALALCSLLLKEGKFDQDRCENVKGFDEIKARYEQLDITDCANRAGMRAGQLRKLERILTSSPMVLAISQRRRLEDQFQTALLNLLLGNIGVGRPMTPLPQLSLPGISELREAEDLPDAIQSGEIEQVILVNVNPCFTSPAPKRWRAALSRAKHVVTAASMRNETTAHADIVLPLSLPAECSDIYLDVGEDGLNRVFVREAVPPPAALVSRAEIALGVATRLGGDLVGRFDWKTLDAYASAVRVTEPPEPTLTLASFSDWVEPEFAEGELFLLPEWSAERAAGGAPNLPYLSTSIGSHVREWWQTYVEINPETAERMSIRNKEKVILRSGAGRIEARARYFEGVPPDAVGLPLGVGHQKGVFAQEGGNPAELIELRRDPRTRVTLFDLQKVTIERVRNG